MPDRGTGSSSQARDDVPNLRFMPTPGLQQRQTVVIEDVPAPSVPDGGASFLEQVDLQEMPAP